MKIPRSEAWERSGQKVTSWHAAAAAIRRKLKKDSQAEGSISGWSPYQCCGLQGHLNSVTKEHWWRRLASWAQKDLESEHNPMPWVRWRAAVVCDACGARTLNTPMGIYWLNASQIISPSLGFLVLADLVKDHELPFYCFRYSQECWGRETASRAVSGKALSGDTWMSTLASACVPEQLPVLDFNNIWYFGRATEGLINHLVEGGWKKSRSSG